MGCVGEQEVVGKLSVAFLLVNEVVLGAHGESVVYVINFAGGQLNGLPPMLAVVAFHLDGLVESGTESLVG